MGEATESTGPPHSAEPVGPAKSTTTRPRADERDDGPDPLLVWCLAAYHTALFVLVPVALVHWVGALGDLLGGLSTVVGLVLYLALWATTWWTNRRLLATTPLRRTDRRAVLKGSVKWGGVTGGCFFLELVGVAVVQVGLAGGLGVPEPASVPPILALLALGTLVAVVVGGLVGVVQATLDLTALSVVDLLV
jgi:hypothetical protein